MASLLSSMSGTQINSTLQIFSEHGVDAKDTAFFRKYRGVFAKSVADAFQLGRRLYEMAIGIDRSAAYDALCQLKQIEDLEIFEDIYRISPLSSIWVAVIVYLAGKDQDKVYHLIRVYSEVARREAIEAGVCRLDRCYLQQLEVGEYIPNWIKEMARLALTPRSTRVKALGVEQTEFDRHRADRD